MYASFQYKTSNEWSKHYTPSSENLLRCLKITSTVTKKIESGISPGPPMNASTFHEYLNVVLMLLFIFYNFMMLQHLGTLWNWERLPLPELAIP